MSADLLRRAAVKLREHAEAVKPGPWEVDHEGMWFELRSRATFRYDYEADLTDVHSPDDTWPLFDYFAMLHPPVALALAELLDAYAEWFELPPFTSFKNGVRERYVAVAREILREPQP